TDSGIELHHFEDALASAIAGVMAIIAAAAAHESRAGGAFGTDAGSPKFLLGRLVRLLAFWADKTHQPLRHDGDDAGSNQEGLNPDIDQSCNSTGRIVRV